MPFVVHDIEVDMSDINPENNPLWDMCCAILSEAQREDGNPASLFEHLEFYAKDISRNLIPEIRESKVLEILMMVLKTDPGAALSCLATVTAHEDEISEWLVENGICDVLIPLFGVEDFTKRIRTILMNLISSEGVDAYEIVTKITVQNAFAFVDDTPSGARFFMVLARERAIRFFDETLWEKAVQFSMSEATAELGVWTLYYIIASGGEIHLQDKLIEIISGCLTSSNESLVYAGCKLVLNLEKRGVFVVQMDALMHLFACGSSQIEKTAALCVRELILNANELEFLAGVLQMSDAVPYDLKKEIAIAFLDLIRKSNATRVMQLLSLPLLPCFIEYIESLDRDVMRLVLLAMLRIVEVCEDACFMQFYEQIQETGIMDIINENDDIRDEYSHDWIALCSAIQTRLPDEMSLE